MPGDRRGSGERQQTGSDAELPETVAVLVAGDSLEGFDRVEVAATTTADPAAVSDRLGAEAVDCVVVDAGVDETTIERLVECAADARPAAATVLAGEAPLGTVAAAVAAGVDRYCPDPDPDAVAAAVADRRAERDRLAHRQAVLDELYRITVDTDLPFEEKADRLLDIGREELGTSYAVLSRLEGETYVNERLRGDLGDGAVEDRDAVPLSWVNCERTVRDEGTLVVNDIPEDPELAAKEGNQMFGLRCYLGTPVVVDGEVTGTLCFFDDQPREQPFSDWHTTLVDLMGVWVSYERERRRRERRLARERDRLDEFVGAVSHDLRNPLNRATLRLELARDTDDPTHLDEAEEALDRMEALIDDALSLARAGEAVVETAPVDLEAVAREAWGTVADTDHASLVVEDPPTVAADESRLRRLLANLLRNAVEHGAVSPPSQAQENAAGHGVSNQSVTVRVGGLSDGEGFYVADDGPGVPEDRRETVFDSGYTTADDGTGFGLAIVAEVAEAHGWTATVTEADSGGARFELRGVETR